jgi:hypothetical protein
MERLWIANIEPGTSDDELKALVLKYTQDPIECTTIQRVEGDGSRPGALMTFTGKKFDTLGKLALRLNGMYWKGRRLVAEATPGLA